MTIPRRQTTGAPGPTATKPLHTGVQPKPIRRSTDQSLKRPKFGRAGATTGSIQRKITPNDTTELRPTEIEPKLQTTGTVPHTHPALPRPTKTTTGRTTPRPNRPPRMTTTRNRPNPRRPAGPLKPATLQLRPIQPLLKTATDKRTARRTTATVQKPTGIGTGTCLPPRPTTTTPTARQPPIGPNPSPKTTTLLRTGPTLTGLLRTNPWRWLVGLPTRLPKVIRPVLQRPPIGSVVKIRRKPMALPKITTHRTT